jgi:hypothetical protein
VNVRQSSGYLYFFGNGSVSVLSNVNTSGSPATTTFNYQNVDPQAGLDFRDSIQDFGKSIITSNNLGIFGLYGGSLANISRKIEQLFELAAHPDVGGIEPSAAIMTIYDVKHYINYLTLVDPDTGVARNVMLLWNERLDHCKSVRKPDVYRHAKNLPANTKHGERTARAYTRCSLPHRLRWSNG